MKINNLLVILACTIVSGHVSAQLALPYRQTEILQTSLLESPQAKPSQKPIAYDVTISVVQKFLVLIKNR